MPKAIVLGGYGLIGAAIMRHLAEAGFQVTGLGRSRAATRPLHRFDWIIRDITDLSVSEWSEALSGVDLVINAAGALQDGARDNLRAIHVSMVDRLTQALPAKTRMVQISAVGVSPEASTDFFRTKAEGDALVAARARDWVILRPALVLAPEAYGGTALLRAASSLPLILPDVLPEARIQTVHVDEVAATVVAAATGRIPHGGIIDLAEPDDHSFPDLCQAIRQWLGLPPARIRPSIPRPLLNALGKAADALGHLGWRSPLRTTALTALGDGVRADPSSQTISCRSLADTLAAMPATRQDRLFARMYLALPLAIGTLALFWLTSGLIGLVRAPSALETLADTSLAPGTQTALVVGGGLIDMALGMAILWRPLAKRAAAAMVALSFAYMAGSLIHTPALWADPLGPMLKVLPGTVLALLVALALEDR